MNSTEDFLNKIVILKIFVMKTEAFLCKCGSVCMTMVLAILAFNFLCCIVGTIFVICKCVCGELFIPC